MDETRPAAKQTALRRSRVAAVITVAAAVATLAAAASTFAQGSASSGPVETGLTAARFAEIQAALKASSLDGWLFYDFRVSDRIAYRILGVDPSPEKGIRTRRWYCLIPAVGPPQKLLHAIEPHALEAVPGPVSIYASWQARDRELARMLRGMKRVAMQYSPRSAIPSVAQVDAGTVELVRSVGPEVVSSADLVARIASVLNPEELVSHARAAELISADLDATAQEAVRRIRAGNPANERELQDYVLARWMREGLQADGARPLVYVGANAADPHYQPPISGSAVAERDTILLLDFFARAGNGPHAIYGDLARIYYLGETVPADVARISAVVFEARDTAIELLRARVEAGLPVTGAEVDDAARQVIVKNGFGERILHRTGHSIGIRVHGDGVNNDDFESHDTRQHVGDTCFSIEPGIYLPGRFGVRSEVDVCLRRGDRPGRMRVEVRGATLNEVPALLRP